MHNSVQPSQSSRTVFVKWPPWKQGEAGLRWRLRFGDYFILLHFFALPAEHFGSLTDALRSRLPKGVIASALLSITMTDQGERERECKNVILSPLHFLLFRCFTTMTRHVTDRKDVAKNDVISVGGINLFPDFISKYKIWDNVANTCLFSHSIDILIFIFLLIF